jgi:hypothetical protein
MIIKHTFLLLPVILLALGCSAEPEEAASEDVHGGADTVANPNARLTPSAVGASLEMDARTDCSRGQTTIAHSHMCSNHPGMILSGCSYDCQTGYVHYTYEPPTTFPPAPNGC